MSNLLCRTLALSALLAVPAASAFAQKAGSFSPSDLAPGVKQGPSSDIHATPAQRSADLKALFADMWQDQLVHDPEFATSIGDTRYNNLLDDRSVTAYDASLARGAAYLTRLAAISTDGLPEEDKLSKDLMVRTLVEQQTEAVFKPWELPVNQFYGIQVDLPALQGVCPFKTVKDYDDYIARMRAVPIAFNQTIEDLQAGVEDKRTPPRYLLQKVLEETQTIAAQKAVDSPFARPLTKFPASISATDQKLIRANLLEAIEASVLPSYQRFANFLQMTYIPAGRTEPGVWSLPDGKAYYEFLVKQSTTTDMTPAQIHQIGLDQVAEDEAQLLAIAKKLGYPTIAALRAKIAADPKEHATSRAQVLAVYRGYIDGMRPQLPQYFGILPKAPLQVEPVPEYSEKEQAEAYYEAGTPDGSRPGTIYVNTYDFAHRSLTDAESTAYHEGIPGHHLQISIAQELTGLPEFRKYAGYTAYTEGWALYAEHLGKDMGFYKDPYSDFGRLEADEFRGVRLVVDTGVHADHWTRQQMIDYFHAHTGLDETTIQAETDRYIAWPAQALGYKIGQLEILKLRAEAEKQLGPKFSYRTFHDEILDAGALPMDVLDARVTAWITAQSGAQKGTGQ
jgi:uncharacterized protein (DUF885 family)